MKSRNYDDYKNSIQKTNIEIKDLINDKKVLNNLDKIEIDLNALNYIISNNLDDIYHRIDALWTKNPECFKVLPILAAIRHKKDRYYIFNNRTLTVNEFIKTKQDVIDFLKETKIIDFILKRKIKNFVDYVLGVEVGLDTNARKNRNGKKQQKEIYEQTKQIFKNYDFINVKWEQSYHLINEDLAKKHDNHKKLDIVIENKKTNEKFLVEVSFYNDSGSKINETVKSYSKLYEDILDYDKNFKFIWIADGYGILSVKNDFRKYYENNEYIYNTKQYYECIKQLVLKNYKND